VTGCFWLFANRCTCCGMHAWVTSSLGRLCLALCNLQTIHSHLQYFKLLHNNKLAALDRLIAEASKREEEVREYYEDAE
jgi:hypothetical protein